MAGKRGRPKGFSPKNKVYIDEKLIKRLVMESLNEFFSTSGIEIQVKFHGGKRRGRPKKTA